ncbi:hypothetical protein [Niabella ginsengisoli]|uniref:Uncharacterized protein n=1 Tax=Niabella ginsengisoli TaxID=522298 RepID=A0ABS9SPY3_9BACT|nr:hypothetical protein [Niabella ginsengisoli]MCH5600438.1 hypothetical protein [Niabella ginsengisoli]
MTKMPSTGYEATADSYYDATGAFGEFTNFKLETVADTSDLTLYYHTFQDASDANSDIMSFRVVPGGLDFYKEYELAGVKFKALSLVAPATSYPFGYYEDAAKTFKIVPVVPPVNAWFVANNWAFAYSGVGVFGKTYWNTSKANLTANGYTLNNFNINGNYYSYKAITFVLNNGAIQGGVTYNITPVAGTRDEVSLSLAGGILNLTGGFGVTHWSAGLNQLSAPLSGKTFRITASTTNKPNEILLTDKANAANTFKLVIGTISDPFNK